MMDDGLPDISMTSSKIRGLPPKRRGTLQTTKSPDRTDSY